MEHIKVRFPPSPTGYCHVGTARMALVNYLFARKGGGSIVFRSEDTDHERSTKEFENDIVESIQWLGLSWDEFYRQSERVAEHRAALEKLIGEDKAYESSEPSKKDPSQVVKVIRLRNPNKVVSFHDIVRGEISFDTTELKDFVIARSIDDPLYHLSVVIDDAEMGISHVIRGEEHISNTPRQILIQEALGYARPQYAHYPLFLGADKSKLSKRKGDVAIRDYRAAGFVPEAMVNFIGVLGWTPPSGKEVLSLSEMVEEFDLGDLHKSGAVFDIEKLRWYNRHYILAKDDAGFASYALPTLEQALAMRSIPFDASIAHTIMPIIRERISVADDIKNSAAEGEYDYFFIDPTPTASKIPGKGSDAAASKKHLSAMRDLFASASDDDFGSPERVRSMVWDYATAEGRAAVLWPLRYVLSGKERSPDPFIIAAIIGKNSSIRRIESALAML